VRISTIVVIAVLGGCTCSCSQSPTPRDGAPPKADAARDKGPVDGPVVSGDGGGWVVSGNETFESTTVPTASWSPDTQPDDGPFSDNGVYFQNDGVTPPTAYRISAPFGQGGWLTIESYTRNQSTTLAQLVSIVDDPAGAGNKVLRITSPAHTDATVIRPTAALPSRYRISLRVGYPQFGDGKPGNNGYDSGDESAEPWVQADATEENGFYWLTILDAQPRPHNNVWIHHHRKVCIDSDNHYPPWMEIYDGSSFISSGEHPVMMFAVDGTGQGDENSGKPMLSYSAGQWQPSGEIRAVDAYKPARWYTVSIERDGDKYTMQISGEFAYGGQQTYRATIDAAGKCVWHYNNTALAATSPCVDTGNWPSLDSSFPFWPEGKAWPDYFMFGEPHANFYEGYVYYDDVKLEVWK
jgi:hypothetical protein